MVTFSEITAERWYEWHQSFVVDGASGQDREKSGTLEYLAEDTTVLFGLTMIDVRPVDVVPPKLKKVPEVT